MRRRLLLLLCLACCLAGCSGAGVGAVEPSGAATPAPLLAGRVLLERAAAGAQVEIDGATTVTDGSGGFRMARPDGPALLVATVDGSPFRRVLSGSERWAGVNAVTNLVALYLEAHPQVDPAEAERRVKAFLQIPAGIQAAYGLEDLPGSPFSHRVFLDQAAQNGGVEAFSRALAGQVDGGPPRPFVLATGVAFWKDLGLQVAADLSTDVLGSALKFGIGWALSAMNVNIGEAGELRNLAAQIQQITAQVSQIQDGVIRAFAAGELQSLTNTLEQEYTSPFDQLNGSFVTQLQTVVPTNVPLTPSQPLSDLVQNLLASDLEGFLAVLNDVMQGRNLSPCVPRLLAAQRNAQVGAGSSDRLVVVENGSIATMQAVYDYYASYQTLAYNLLAESVHVADAPAAGIQLARGFTLEFFANLKAQSLLIPLPWKYRLVLDRGGSMWYGELQGAWDVASAERLPPLDPGGPVILSFANREDWTLPTVQQADRLFGMMQAGIYGPDLAAQGPGPALQELGFQVDALDGHTKIWVNSNDRLARYNLTTGEADESYSQTDDYPYLAVRPFPAAEDADTARTAGVPSSIEVILVSSQDPLLTATAVMDVAGEEVPGVDLTDRVVWTSANPALVEVSNQPGSEGTLMFRYDPAVQFSQEVDVYASDRPIRFVGGQVQPADAVYGRIRLSTPPVDPPALTSLSLTPRNVLFGTLPTSRPYHVTAFYADGSVREVTTEAAFSVRNSDGTQPLPAQEGAFSSSVPGVLILKSALTLDLVTLQAVWGGLTGSTQAGAPVFGP